MCARARARAREREREREREGGGGRERDDDVDDDDIRESYCTHSLSWKIIQVCRLSVFPRRQCPELSPLVLVCRQNQFKFGKLHTQLVEFSTGFHLHSLQV